MAALKPAMQLPSCRHVRCPKGRAHMRMIQSSQATAARLLPSWKHSLLAGASRGSSRVQVAALKFHTRRHASSPAVTSSLLLPLAARPVTARSWALLATSSASLAALHM